MKKLLLYALIVISFSACSFKTPPNEWQYKSANAFDSYTKNFLGANESLAKDDLNTAVQNAKRSADLTPLARIYLGECALNISVGLTDKCNKYKDIADIANNKALDAYFAFLTSSMTNEQINKLPKNYQKFALHAKNSEFAKADNELLNISKPTSLFLAAALIKKDIADETIEEVVKTASFHGYKKVVIFWLNEKKNRTADIDKKNKISKKISILESLN